MTEMKTKEITITSDATDKRIKNCVWCDTVFRDGTRPNNKRSCSKECADNHRKQRQREKYAEETAHIPKRPTQFEIYEASDPEFPFWDTRIMQNLAQKHESLQSPDRLETIVAAKQRAEINGGRRKTTESIPYDGDEKGKHGVSVRFADHDHKKAGEVVTTKMSAVDMERYFTEKYGNRRKSLACRKKS